MAEIKVELLDQESGWSPYINIKDAGRLDNLRRASASRDLKTAISIAKVYRLEEVTVD